MNVVSGRSPRGALAFAFCCLVVLTLFVPTTVAAREEISITDLSFAQENLVETGDDGVFLWQSEPATLSVSIETGVGSGDGHYEVCVRSTPENRSTTELRCRETVLSGDGENRVTFEFETWPDNVVGAQNLSVIVFESTLSRDVRARASESVSVLEMDGDFDGEGLTNRREVEAGTNVTDPDTDHDGLDDALELRSYGTDPRTVDTDGDSLVDGEEVHDYRTDPTTADTDDDGLGDSAEIREYESNPNDADSDGDGLDDSAEINTYGTNASNPDSDGDGLDDHVEVKRYETNPAVPDTDGDGLTDPLELYSLETDPQKGDTDDDGLDDGAEVYEYGTEPTNADTDSDGLDDGGEVHAYETNPHRADTDGDGLVDGAEVNDYGTNPAVADTDGDGRTDGREFEENGFGLPDGLWLVLAGIGVALVGGVLAYRVEGFPAVRPSLPVGRPTDELRRYVGRLRNDGSDDEENTPEPDDSLTNEERVIALLEANGGRMKQARIVEETEWSKATVSRVLTAMQRDDLVSKIDIGRGNLVALPSREPSESKPPFDDRDTDRSVD